jgi:hypothetical protein
MGNLTEHNFFKGRSSDGLKIIWKKMLTISGQKGNANKNHTNIPSHSC